MVVEKVNLIEGGLASKNKKNDSAKPNQQQLERLLEDYQNGLFGDAEKLSRSLAEKFPLHDFSWKVLASVLKKTDRLSEAVSVGEKIIEAFPYDSEAHFNLGNTLNQLGRFDEAETCYWQAIALRPDYAVAYNNLGDVLKSLGRLNEAEEQFNRAIVLRPDFIEAHGNLGATLRLLDRLDEAEISIRQVIALKPDYAEAHNNLGNTLEECGRLEEAEACYRHAILLKPSFVEAQSNLGVTLQRLGRLEEAEACFRHAVALKPEVSDVYGNLGVTLKGLGRLQEAESCFRHLIALKPEYAEAYSNLGSVLQEQGKLEQAKVAFEKAIALKPEFAQAHHNLCFTLLHSGRLEEGFDEHEWRWEIPDNLPKYRHFSQPLWDGKESLQGKRILLWSEQGIGDTLNWASCLPLLTAQAEHTILECQDKLVPLLARSFPNVEIRPENRSMDSQRDDFDFHLPMGSLYRHFAPDIGDHYNVEAYLLPDPARVKFWKNRLTALGKGPYVGVCWKSSIVSPFRLKHYPPITEWASVLTIPDVTFINLQYSDFADDLAIMAADFGVIVQDFDDLDQYNNVDDVAALCAALDMVVTTKVTPMIFSSGVGTPTKIANWRQSIWNTVLTNPVCSSVEMFHRDTWESWNNVFNSISADVLKLKK